jgi:hypothetical protein
MKRFHNTDIAGAILIVIMGFGVYTAHEAKDIGKKADAVSIHRDQQIDDINNKLTIILNQCTIKNGQKDSKG